MAREAASPRAVPDKKTGIYYIHWTRNGRSHRRSTHTKDKALAEQIAARFILEQMHLGADSDDPTVSTLLSEYEQEHVRHHVRSRTTYHYVEKNLLEGFGTLQLRDVTAQQVYSYMSARATGAIGNPSKSSTVRRELGVLNAAINHAIKTRRIPAGDKPYIPLPEDSAPKDRWLTKAEAQKLYDACPVNDPETGRMTRAFRLAKIMINTAARRGAVEELKWDQIDFENEVIHFNPPGRKQTKKRRATVPINADLLLVLERAWDERLDDTYVLDTNKSAYAEFKAAARRAGLDDVTPHTLRHTFGTWAAQRGVPLWKIAGVMGDTIETTSRHYLHHCPDELRDAV